MKIFQTIFKWCVITYITLAVLVWLISPVIIRHFANQFLVPHQLVLSEQSSIRYNPVTAHVQIKELSLLHQDKTVFSIEALEFESRLYQLMFDTIYISEFEIHGLHLDIEKQGERLILAGVVVNDSPDIDADTPITESPDAAITNESGIEEAFPYTISVPELSVLTSNISYSEGEYSHQVKIKQFKIKDLSASQKSQRFALTLDSEINKANFSINAKGKLENNIGKVESNIQLNNFSLNNIAYLLPTHVDDLSGFFSLALHSNIDVNNNTLDISFNSLSSKLTDLSLAANDIKLSNPMVSFDATDIFLNDVLNETLTYEGDFSFNAQSLKLSNAIEQQVLLGVEQFSIANAKLLGQAESFELSLPNINVNALYFSDDTGNELAPLSRVENITVSDISLTKSAVAIKDIAISGLQVDALIDETGKLTSLVEMPSQANANDEAKLPSPEQVSDTTTAVVAKQSEEKSAAGKPFAIRLNNLSIINPAHIRFNDESVSPHYARDFTIETLALSDIDNANTAQKSQFKLSGKSNEYAHFDVNVAMTPFAPKPLYNIAGHFKEVSLPGVSSYIKDALQHEIESGQLDLTFSSEITGALISGDADVLLRGIEFKDVEEVREPEKGFVPFDVALGMLKDSDGNVALSLPLSGDINSPSFGVSGFLTLLVKQATMSAAKDYLFTTFVPYANVVKIAMVAGEYALKVNIKPLVFNFSDTELTEQQQVFLNEFSALMTDKPDLQIKLCGVATPKDIGLSTKQDITDKAIIKQLNDISKKRVENFKAYMVKEKNIPSARLLTCQPKIATDEDATAKIKFKV